MQANLIFSRGHVITAYLISERTTSAVKTGIKLKLITKKFLFNFYKKLLKFTIVSNLLHSYILVSYFMVKKWVFIIFSESLINMFGITTLLFLLYHFLTLYRAIFLMKMILDWFPIKNWDRSSPLKRFLRRVTIDWTRQFEKYFPSIFAWLIVINIIPIVLSLLETSFIVQDLKNFPMSYCLEEFISFSNAH